MIKEICGNFISFNSLSNINAVDVMMIDIFCKKRVIEFLDINNSYKL
jgi:hypothetical protein